MFSRFVLLSAFIVVALTSHSHLQGISAPLVYFRYSPFRNVRSPSITIYKSAPVIKRLIEDYPYDAPVAAVTPIVNEDIPASIVHSASVTSNMPKSFDVPHADESFPSPVPSIVPFTRDSYGLSLMDNSYIPDSGHSNKN